MVPSVKKTSEFTKRKCTECSSILDQKCDAGFFLCNYNLQGSKETLAPDNKVHAMVCAPCFNTYFTRKSLEIKTN